MITNETPEEREEFNRVERESKAKQESIRGTKHPTREQLIAELDVAQMLIRELGDRLSKLEKPLAAEKEREACALICDAVTQDMSLGPLEKYRAAEIAKLIRARGQA